MLGLVLPAASRPSSSILIGLLPNSRFHARFMHDIAQRTAEEGRTQRDDKRSRGTPHGRQCRAETRQVGGKRREER